ncbi:tyrosine-type recombinase/integrase [Lichenicoccus sp.]|uniref:tyrosine-type recombinase/integrase n=1 Tax=Lichenicoccus sp. TaxID=2781899 RepID=UPI003D106C91
MVRGLNRLTALAAARAKPGLYGDGGGLWLRVQPNGRAWLFRYTSPTTGRERRMGLGTLQDVSLADARTAAAAARRELQAGLDPLVQRELFAAKLKRERITFRKAAEACIAAKQVGWRNAKHAGQWAATLEAYVYPKIGDATVAAVTKADVLEILTPIWQAKPETATRVRGRIETVLDYAKQLDWRAGENPAVWKGNLQHARNPTVRAL